MFIYKDIYMQVIFLTTIDGPQIIDNNKSKVKGQQKEKDKQINEQRKIN